MVQSGEFLEFLFFFFNISSTLTFLFPFTVQIIVPAKTRMVIADTVKVSSMLTRTVPKHRKKYVTRLKRSLRRTEKN